MKYLRLACLLMLWVCGASLATEIPKNAHTYLPMLAHELDIYWPDVPYRSLLAAQIETESCVSLKSSKCWTPYAELKTARENGIGLGQLTITKTFDNFAAAKKLDPSLKDWSWDNRYNAEYQLRTLVLMNKFTFAKLPWAANVHEQMAFMFAAYNGGLGGVLSDRSVCRATYLCDESRWFGNVEYTSKKAKVAASGYGLSFFQINRLYVKNIFGTRRIKYMPYFSEVE